MLQDKIGSQEVILTTICQFSKCPVTIPVRHSPINYIHCVFELEVWIEHYLLMYNKVDPTYEILLLLKWLCMSWMSEICKL